MDCNHTTRTSAIGGGAAHREQCGTHVSPVRGEQLDEVPSPLRARDIVGIRGDDTVSHQPTDDDPYSTVDKETETIKAFALVSERWNLSDQQAASLLGTDAETWLALRDRVRPLAKSAASTPPPSNLAHRRISLTEEQLSRISIFFYMYVSLLRLFAKDSANRWVTCKNFSPVFKGRTPLDAMIEGGLPKVREARDYVSTMLW